MLDFQNSVSITCSLTNYSLLLALVIYTQYLYISSLIYKYMVTLTNDDLASINRKLDALIAIMINRTKIEGDTTKDKIGLLIRLGFDNLEISNILGTTSGLVAKERSIFKKRKGNE